MPSCGTVLSLLIHPSDLVAVLRARALASEAKKLTNQPGDDALSYCYQSLHAVSRSFAVVICRLPPALRDAVCIFYLVLRALDTVEDDMQVPKDVKQRILPQFHLRLEKGGNCDDLPGVGIGHEAELLERFREVVDVFQRLPKKQQHTIADICKQMGEGMCEFLDLKVGTHEEYDRYCHYVAGLVGHGLTALFASSGHEPGALSLDDGNEMGLMLQKTNIIRDYREDAEELPPRVWWPRSVWGSRASDVREFMLPGRREDGLACIRELIADALRHVPACVRYLSALQDAGVFAFCAAPQVMAIATLAEVYDNPKVLQTKVKVSKPVAAQIMVSSGTRHEVRVLMMAHLRRIGEKAQRCGDCATMQAIEAATASLHVPSPPELDGDVAVPCASRAFLTSYPASLLGGNLVYGIYDFLCGVFKPPSSTTRADSQRRPPAVRACSTGRLG